MNEPRLAALTELQLTKRLANTKSNIEFPRLAALTELQLTKRLANTKSNIDTVLTELRAFSCQVHSKV